MPFLHPLKSGAGVVVPAAIAASAPETLITGDIGQQQRLQQQVREQGMPSDKLDLEQVMVTLDDITVPGQSEPLPLSEAIDSSNLELHPNAMVSEDDDEQLPEQEDQQQVQQQQQHQHGTSTDPTEYSLATIKAPFPTSLYPKGFLRQKPSTGILSPPTQSTASSMADLNNSSSASITANMLAIKSHVFVQQDHQQPRLMPVVTGPIYQLSTPMSSTNSLLTPSRSASPVHFHHHTPITKASSPLITRSGLTLEATTPIDSSTAQQLAIPVKDELRPGQSGSVKTSKSRSGKGHSSNSSSCSWTSSLAPPSVDEMDIGKDSQTLSPAPLSSASSAAPPLAPPPAPPTSRRSKRSSTYHHDHSLSSVFDDLKSKTQNVLRKAGFSIAPEAGLFADRGSTKPADLKVIRLFPASAAFLSRPSDRHSHLATDPKDSSGPGRGVGAASVKGTGFFGRPRSRSVRETSRPMLELDAAVAQKRTSVLSAVTSPSATVMTTSPTAIDHPSPGSPPPTSSSSSLSVFKFERWPLWNLSDKGGGGHQRSNSGPAQTTDWGVRKRRMTIGLEHTMSGRDRILGQQTSSSSGDHIRTGSGPSPPLPPLPTTLATADVERMAAEEKKMKGHQRRVSDATTLTMTSMRSAGASPQRLQLQQIQQQQHSYPPLPGTVSSLQHQAIPEKQPAPRSMMGNLFGMVSKRRSFPSVEEEDPTRRFGYGGQQYHCHGFEVTGVGSQRNSMIVLDDGDEDLDDMDEDSDLEDDEHASAATGEEGGRVTPMGGKVRRRRQVLVNDYGFICEPEDNNSNITNNSGSGVEGQN
ncbi:hypothetical protein BGW39_004207, partial [Mortierella sp. 14UC]